MRVKLFVEPRGKVREEVLLESSVPLDMKSFRRNPGYPIKNSRSGIKDHGNHRFLVILDQEKSLVQL